MERHASGKLHQVADLQPHRARPKYIILFCRNRSRATKLIQNPPRLARLVSGSEAVETSHFLARLMQLLGGAQSAQSSISGWRCVWRSSSAVRLVEDVSSYVR